MLLFWLVFSYLAALLFPLYRANTSAQLFCHQSAIQLQSPLPRIAFTINSAVRSFGSFAIVIVVRELHCFWLALPPLPCRQPCLAENCFVLLCLCFAFICLRLFCFEYSFVSIARVACKFEHSSCYCFIYLAKRSRIYKHNNKNSNNNCNCNKLWTATDI